MLCKSEWQRCRRCSWRSSRPCRAPSRQASSLWRSDRMCPWSALSSRASTASTTHAIDVDASRISCRPSRPCPLMRSSTRAIPSTTTIGYIFIVVFFFFSVLIQLIRHTISCSSESTCLSDGFTSGPRQRSSCFRTARLSTTYCMHFTFLFFFKCLRFLSL